MQVRKASLIKRGARGELGTLIPFVDAYIGLRTSIHAHDEASGENLSTDALSLTAVAQRNGSIAQGSMEEPDALISY